MEPDVYYCMHNKQPIDLILVQFNPVSTLTLSFSIIHFDINQLSVPSLLSGIFPCSSVTCMYACYIAYSC